MIILVRSDFRNICRYWPNGAQIRRSLGMPINVGDTYSFLPLRSPAFMISGEHEGDYIQFTQGDWSWTSRTTMGVQMEDGIHGTDHWVDSGMGTRMWYV